MLYDALPANICESVWYRSQVRQKRRFLVAHLDRRFLPLALDSLPAVNWPVRETLPNDALKRLRGALAVINWPLQSPQRLRPKRTRFSGLAGIALIRSVQPQ